MPYCYTIPMNQEIVHEKDRSISKGIVVAMSCEILRINDETYRVQSEKAIDRYYIVRFKDHSPEYCSCKDWEIRSQLNSHHVCKHMRAVLLAEIWGLTTENTIKELNPIKDNDLQYKRDEYSF